MESNGSMDIVMKSWVAAVSSFNAVAIGEDGNRVNVMDCGMDTSRITTLGEYLGKYDPTKLSNLDKSRQMDEDRLMKTYVLPLVLPNGQTVDLVVNSKGQDMACVYKGRDGKEAEFDLTPRMKKEIMKNGMNGVQGIIDTQKIEDALYPKDLEEFAREVEKDTLVPRTPEETVEKVKSKYEQADISVVNDEKNKEQNKDEEKEEEEPTKQGMTISEASMVMNMDADKLASAVGANAKILGYKFVSDIEGLEENIDEKLNGAGSKVALVKVAGPELTDQTYILSYPDAKTLHSPEQGNPALLSELVKTGENGGESIEDMDKAIEDSKNKNTEVETADIQTGKEIKETVEKGNPKEIEEYSDMSKEIIMQANARVREVLSGNGNLSEKYDACSKILKEAGAKLDGIQTNLSVAERDTLGEINDMSNEYSERSQEEKNKEEELKEENEQNKEPEDEGRTLGPRHPERYGLS